jgi:hypothetical protein
VQQVRRVLQAHKGSTARRVLKVMLVRRVQQAHKEAQVHKDHKAM